MALELSPELESRIAEKVESSGYPDADAVIERALDLLNEVERLDHLSRLIAVGADQAARGEVIPYDDALRAEMRESARRRFAAGEVAGPDVRP